MFRLKFCTFAAALALSATAAPAQLYPLTNGPNGTRPNTPDSQKGFDGINAVAPERGPLYHPEAYAGSSPALGAVPDGSAVPGALPRHRSSRHHRRRETLR